MIPTPSSNGRHVPLQPEGCGSLLAGAALLGAWLVIGVGLVALFSVLWLARLLGR